MRDMIWMHATLVPLTLLQQALYTWSHILVEVYSTSSYSTEGVCVGERADTDTDTDFPRCNSGTTWIGLASVLYR